VVRRSGRDDRVECFVEPVGVEVPDGVEDHPTTRLGHLDQHRTAISSTMPSRRGTVSGRLGSRNSPYWSIEADIACWPATVSATVVAAPISGMSRNVAVTYTAA
jgi:hypothetical protein